MDVEILKETIRDMEYQKYMEFMNKQICSVFGISKEDLNNKVLETKTKI